MSKHSYREIGEFCASIYGNAPILIVPYSYSLNFDAPGAAGTKQSQQLSITANADFVLTDLSSMFSILPSNGLDVSATLLITDSGSGDQFTNSPINVSCYASAVARNLALPFPRFIQGRTSLNVELASFYTGATFGDFYKLSLNGVLVRKL